MEYAHNFDEICSKVPFPALLDHLKTPYKIEGNTLKSDDVIVSIDKCTRNGFTYSLFVWKNKAGKQKGGGSILDYVQDTMDIKSKIKACEWLEKNILGQNTQKEVPILELQYGPELAFYRITEQTCKEYGVGTPKGKTVMQGRICFQLIDHENKHRGYIGFDFTEKKKAKWFVPQGTKTGDMLYNYYRKNGKNACIMVEDPLRAAYLFSIGFCNTVSPLNGVLTQEQKKLLSVFRYITVIGEHMQGTSLGILGDSFVRLISKDPLKLERDDIMAYF